MGKHGTTADAHRKDYYSGARASKHMQRKFEAGDVADRFVLPPADPPATQATKRRKPSHPNAALVMNLRDNELRACYRATFKEDPGQMGRDKILAVFLEKKAPRALVPTSYAPDYSSVFR